MLYSFLSCKALQDSSLVSASVVVQDICSCLQHWDLRSSSYFESEIQHCKTTVRPERKTCWKLPVLIVLEGSKGDASKRKGAASPCCLCVVLSDLLVEVDRPLSLLSASVPQIEDQHE